MRKIKATSLVEIVVASLILAVAFAGFVAGFVSVRKYIARSQKRLVGTNVTRENFGYLTGDVNATTWGVSGNLAPGPAVSLPALPPIDGITYAGNRVVSAVPGANYVSTTISVNFPVD